MRIRDPKDLAAACRVLQGEGQRFHFSLDELLSWLQDEGSFEIGRSPLGRILNGDVGSTGAIDTVPEAVVFSLTMVRAGLWAGVPPVEAVREGRRVLLNLLHSERAHDQLFLELEKRAAQSNDRGDIMKIIKEEVLFWIPELPEKHHS
jgi:hypothetical protein